MEINNIFYISDFKSFKFLWIEIKGPVKIELQSGICFII